MLFQAGVDVFVAGPAGSRLTGCRVEELGRWRTGEHVAQLLGRGCRGGVSVSVDVVAVAGAPVGGSAGSSVRTAVAGVRRRSGRTVPAAPWGHAASVRPAPVLL